MDPIPGAEVPNPVAEAERRLSQLLDRKLWDVLSQTSVETLLAHRPVIYVSSADTLGHAFETLAKNKILSAPVRDPISSRVTGIIEMFDILAALLNIFHETKDIKTPTGVQHWSHWITDLGQMLSRGESLSKAYVYMHLRPHPAPAITRTSSVPKLLEHFHAGHHRVLVTDEKGEALGIVSQSQVVNFLASHINLLDPATAQMTVSGIGLGKQAPFTVGPDVTALHGFDMLRQHKIHALPVVDRSGVLLANLSISDLRAVPSMAGLGAFLIHPIAEYLTNFCPTVQVPPFTCVPNTTLETVILKLSAAHVHRLWCVDPQNRPLGVVSLTDVMSFLYLHLNL